jgi:adenylosuccinate synthase
MALNIIVGTQWGDEGKGHITDLLADEASIVARYSGGDNAGHTVTIGARTFRLHLVPSGIAQARTTCLIGNGVVLNPAVLLRELDQLAAQGIDVSPARLKISGRAHLITPAHIALDEAHEKARGKEAIGTTLRGIGPAYTDKTARRGLRAHLLTDMEGLADAIHEHVAEKNQILVGLYGEAPLDAAAIASEYADFARRLGPHVTDVAPLIWTALDQGETVLAEGAQGTLLDLDHGTYPFVTSSSPTAGGALVGLGVGPGEVGRVVGVAKAFTSRVGSGPFPSEVDGQMAARLRGSGERPWDEFGTTTGRPRRVGWLDLVILGYARRVNGLTELALTKLDILSGLESLPICVGYELDGEVTTAFPEDMACLGRCRPVFEVLPGWAQDLSGARRLADLPANARLYVDYVAESLGIPITFVSVGPGREQVICV